MSDGTHVGHGRQAASFQSFTEQALVLFCTIGLLLKIIVIFQLRHHPLTQPGAGLDTTAYAELAQRVIGGDWGLGPGLYYVSPLYIYFLAAGRALTGSYTAVRLIQAVLGTVGIAAMILTAREWFGPRAAFAAGGLAALTGLFAFYDALILQTSLDVFFTATALLCLTYALKRRDLRWWLATGVIFGIQTMNRPNIALAAAGLVLVLLCVKQWRHAAILAAGLFIGIAPAAIRNVVVAHEFSLLSSHGGLNFYIGNHAGADGFYDVIPGITPSIKGQQEDARRVAEHALGRTLTDAQTSDYFVDQALDWITAHPGDAAFLMLRKLGLVFHAQHVALPYSYPFFEYDAPTWLRFYVIGPWLLVPLGLVGLVFAAPRTNRKDYLVWVAFVPAYAAAVAVFFMSERYRLPLLVPLVVGAGGAIDRIWQSIAAKDIKSLAAPLLTGLVIGVLVNTHTIASDGRWAEGLRMAHQLVILGRFDEAESWIDRLDATGSRKGEAHISIAKQYMQEQQPARALAHLTKGLGSTSTADEWLMAGRLMAEQSTADAAEPYFHRAVEVAGNNPDARQQYGLNLLVLNRFEDAARELGAAAELDPRNAATLSHLAYSEAKLGRIPSARQHLAAALAVDPADPMAVQLAAVLR